MKYIIFTLVGLAVLLYTDHKINTKPFDTLKDEGCFDEKLNFIQTDYCLELTLNK